MMSRVEFVVKGVTPLMTHNIQLADPRNRWAKAIKEISQKRKKTEDDHVEMSRLEFLGGLYLDRSGRPCLPGEGIDSAIVDAAKKTRQGTVAKAGVLTEGSWPILYDGPKDPEKMWQDDRFVDVRPVRIGGSRVMRTRPIFHEWEFRWASDFDPELLNPSDLIAWVTTLGRHIGWFEYRPRFGRFEVVSATVQDAVDEAA